MHATFDINALVKDLEAFCANVSFHLTDEPSMPSDLAERLWEAHKIVASLAEELNRRGDPN